MKMVTQIKVHLIAAAVLIGMAIPVVADEKGKSREEKVKLRDCPAAVQKTINDQAEGGKVLEVEKETNKDGTVIYEAEVKKTSGKKIEISVAEDGKLIEVEDEDDEEDDGDENEDDDDKDDDDKAN